MNIENQKFEEWRNEQIASLIRMGYPDAAKAFRNLGSIQWAGWQAGWQASRAAIEVELPLSPYMPDSDPDSMSSYEIGEAQGRCDMWTASRRAIESLGLKVK